MDVNHYYLTDISKWNIYEVNDMNYLFCGCKYLSSLSAISKWYTA